MNESIENKCNISDVNKMESDILILRNKIAGELTGARWLWTTGQLSKDTSNSSSGSRLSSSGSSSGSSWIPWDTEVVNAAPAILCWKRGVTSIKTRMPGLYKITISIFTSLPCALQLCLNGEPIVTLQPDITTSTNLNGAATMLSAGGGGSNRTALVSDER